MAKTLPYFRWFPADAESDCNFRAMDDSDIGFYLRCLNHAWINGGIPADSKERARVLRTRVDTANKRWIRVGKCWVTSKADDTILVNPRQEVEREYAIRKSELAAESVKHRYDRTYERTTRARVSDPDSDSYKEKPPISPAEFDLEPNAAQAPLARSKPSGRSKRQKRNCAQIGEALGAERIRWWLDFWAVYPCRDGKQEAMNAFELQVVSAETWAAVFAGAKRYAEKSAADPEMRMKFAQGWLNDHRWEDEPAAPNGALVPFPARGQQAVNGRKSFYEDVKATMARNIAKDGKPW